jgi:hypothetical protein
MKFIVIISNGLVTKEMELKKSDWVYDMESAKRMAASKINNAWMVQGVTVVGV